MSSKQDRAKLARETINKTIPKLLSADAVARAGVSGSSLLRDLPALSSSPDGNAHMSIQIWHSDTLNAARKICGSCGGRLAILNMASPLRPGGGILTGASSQEEFLCLRTTLYPALRDEFYRIPETGLIYTQDVLVFRDSTPQAKDLPKSERYHTDIVSSAMLRMPDLKVNEDGSKTWAEDSDKELVLLKMRMVMRALVRHNVSAVVLGAWGCGAYGNPTAEIAKAWKLILLGSRKGPKESWNGVEDVFFATTSQTEAAIFSQILLGDPTSFNNVIE
ncbi:hypothetical protein DL96DRAFT_1470063 [Flagelloscypha sp. PMI_526]|nr:hypothetical protein DL96DRAFT_1470063 [Flagelloscypha sp. PMI_526]